MIGSGRKRLFIALLFLLPNLLGFLIFTAGPIAFSLGMSVTDWALTKHNELSDTPIRFVGAENYARVLWGDESHLFWDYFGNTLFLMIGIPVGIAGSLMLAIMLNANVTPSTKRGRANGVLIAVVLTIIAALGAWMLTTPGAPPTDLSAAPRSVEVGLTDMTQWQVEQLRSNGVVLMVLVLGAIATLGIGIGGVFFRTLFYLPSLLAGVALFLLWKTLYKPRGGLINAGLEPVLEGLGQAVRASPTWLWHGAGIAVWSLAGLLALRLLWTGVDRLRHREVGPAAFMGRLVIVATFAVSAAGIGLAMAQLPERSLLPSGRTALDSQQIADAVQEVAREITALDPRIEVRELELAGDQLGDSAPVRVVIDQLARAAGGSSRARASARRAVNARSGVKHEGFVSGEGLGAPQWLIDSAWAKTALVIMGVWFALGGSTMLLYLAGLSNIPPELYEAAAIDGASGWNRFINVTWPQLAPTTFFIVIMSTIGGLQGGFEQAMVMTQGKADTIVLAYYIYNLAFSDQFQLGLASAVAWIMFAMIFVMTAINFRFGSQMTNE